MTPESRIPIRNNLTHYYGCKINNSSGIFLTTSSGCQPIEKVGEIKELFDIPKPLRVTGEIIDDLDTLEHLDAIEK